MTLKSLMGEWIPVNTDPRLLTYIWHLPQSWEGFAFILVGFVCDYYWICWKRYYYWIFWWIDIAFWPTFFFVASCSTKLSFVNIPDNKSNWKRKKRLMIFRLSFKFACIHILSSCTLQKYKHCPNKTLKEKTCPTSRTTIQLVMSE